MSKNKTILKEAMADAKTIRETALAQAKKALEEEFTPHLQSMLAKKLQEMEDENEDDVIAEEDEMLDLESILAEDDEPEEDAEADETGEGAEAEEVDDEEKDISEMSPEEVESYIREIAAEEFARLEAGDEPGEGEEAEVNLADETGDDEEINLDEMLDETEEGLEENSDNDIDIDALLAELGLSDEPSGEAPVAEVERDFEAELEEAMNTIATMRSQLQEANLINAKSIYLNKVLKKHNLNESQKIQIVETFDKAKTAKDAKLIYESMEVSLNKKVENKKALKESLGFASKASGIIPKNQSEVIATNDFSRWAKLAGLK